MKENNLKAKYIKPYIQTTVSHDFSDKLKNLLNRHYNPTKPNVALWKINKYLSHFFDYNMLIFENLIITVDKKSSIQLSPMEST